MVGPDGEELGDQVALGAHDFDAVVTGFACQPRGVREVFERLLDFRGAHLARRVRIDRRFERRRGDDALMKAIAPRMQELQHDATAGLMHGARNDAMVLGILGGRKLGAMRAEISGVVGREAPGNDERGAAARAFGIKSGEPCHAVRPGLELRMHRAHQDAVRESDASQVERLEEVRVGRHNLCQTSS
jgi:hypothetical protein